MALPINLDDLISGRLVEWERLEFKAGWNPLAVLQSICAFANDINNWGGGYILLGIEEKNGRPVLPAQGLSKSSLDTIQKELIERCHQLRPNYFPIIELAEIGAATILVIWVPGGEVRPYKAPADLNKNNKEFYYYIRRGSITKKASDSEERDLLNMSAHIPFDDQINQRAEITDIKLPLVKAHLASVGSYLLEQSESLQFADLCRKMNIVSGPDEYLKPKNIGLLLFNDNPTQFFQCAQIELVIFEDEVGDSFTEKNFKGPIQQQLQDILLYFKNHIIVERVRKIEGSAEAERFYNYPYQAIEEAVVNTVYHRSYQDDSPIEIRIFSDRIEMVSYPGPLPPLNKEKLHSGRVVARKYRNRRIGDFLKELHLTEGKGTGIPKIKKSMESNGSPAPIFDTDDDLSYFLTILPVHLEFKQAKALGQVRGQVTGQVTGQVDELILLFCRRPKKRREIMSEIGLSNRYENFTRYTKALINNGYLSPTILDKPRSQNQQYKTTALGNEFISKNTGKSFSDDNLSLEL